MADKTSQVDSYFNKIQKYVTGKIGAFVAFFFFIFAAGAFAASIVIQRWPDMAWLVILAPIAAGALAYYNRTFAVILFVLFIVFFFL